MRRFHILTITSISSETMGHNSTHREFYCCSMEYTVQELLVLSQFKVFLMIKVLVELSNTTKMVIHSINIITKKLFFKNIYSPHFNKQHLFLSRKNIA